MAPRFVMTPVGSAGDVLPFVGLGRELVRRGRHVVMITAEPFRDEAEAAGLVFIPSLTTADYERLSDDPGLWHPRRGLRLVLRSVAQRLSEAYARVGDACAAPGVVLVGHTLAFATRLLEEARRIPAATIHLAPSGLRSSHRAPGYRLGLDLSHLPVSLTRALWWIVDRVAIDPYVLSELNRLRFELGLAPVTRPFRGWLSSPRCVLALFPSWFCPSPPDWPAALHLAGFPLFDGDPGAPDDVAVEAFIARGSPPVVITAGTANKHAAGFFAAALSAAASLGRRSLVLTGYPGQLPSPLPRGTLHAPYVPLSRVLHRCAALVHHGGIGTCAQGLAAGVPQLVLPRAFDQVDNARHLVRLGVAKALPDRSSGETVAAALAGLVDSQDVARACQRWRPEMDGPSAIRRACDVLERLGGRGGQG